MGTIIHHAIIVTGYDDKTQALHAAHAKAIECGLSVSGLGPALVNGYTSFCVWPDGSKEGWSESNEGDAKRETFIEWLDRQRWRDGSTPLQWVEVEYGEVGRHDGAKVINAYSDRKIGDGYTGPCDLEKTG